MTALMGRSTGRKLLTIRSHIRWVVAPLATAVVVLGLAGPAWSVPTMGGPSTYRLTVTGTVARGATISLSVENFLNVGLVVTTDDSNLAEPSALVPLGEVNPGNRTLSWNLKVNGQALGAGSYVVALEIFTADGHPSGRAFPPPAVLTISAAGHTSAVMATASTSKTDWLVTVIGILLALVLGLVGGFLLGRTKRTSSPGSAGAS